MELIAFELGRNTNLSLGELNSLIGKENFQELAGKIGIFQNKEFEEFEELKNFQKRIGGSIRSTFIMDKIKIEELNKNILKEKILEIIEPLTDSFSGKVKFSVSTFNIIKDNNIDIKEILNFLKKFIKNNGQNSRFVNFPLHRSAKASAIYKAKVIDKGFDLVIIKGKSDYYLGLTAGIQNLDQYSKRDYNKKVKDTKIGMLPPKLAQIMINLAGKDTQTIYDPFCGTGTILMEALLMKKNALGSDLNQKMVEAAQKNCTWLKNEFNATNQFKVWFLNAKDINASNFEQKIDSIITEGFLGQVFSQKMTIEESNQVLSELKNLHLNWLGKAKKLLNKGEKIVTCIASHRTKEGINVIKGIKQSIEKLGFKVKDKFYYSRPDQAVLRDIYVLEVT